MRRCAVAGAMSLWWLDWMVCDREQKNRKKAPLLALLMFWFVKLFRSLVVVGLVNDLLRAPLDRGCERFLCKRTWCRRGVLTSTVCIISSCAQEPLPWCCPVQSKFHLDKKKKLDDIIIQTLLSTTIESPGFDLAYAVCSSISMFVCANKCQMLLANFAPRLEFSQDNAEIAGVEVIELSEKFMRDLCKRRKHLRCIFV